MTSKLEDIASAMVARGKGILAADESTGTIKKRFDSIGTRIDRGQPPQLSRDAVHRRRRDAQLHLRCHPLRRDASPEIAQRQASGRDHRRIGRGARHQGRCRREDSSVLAGEQITEGLDGLRERLKEYYGLGARFAKWRAVIDIADGLPTANCVQANAHALARYAALCQEQNIVPIVEPEVLMDGPVATHDIDRCATVTEWTLNTVFDELFLARVRLEAIVLKPNMVIAGKNARQQAAPEEVAEKTLRVLKRTVPAAVPGIAFLSGGQSDEQATHHLSLMNAMGELPWNLTFSYGRALQAAALKAWGGRSENFAAGQRPSPTVPG